MEIKEIHNDGSNHHKVNSVGRPSTRQEFNLDINIEQSKQERIASLNNKPNLDLMLARTNMRHETSPIRE